MAAHARIDSTSTNIRVWVSDPAFAEVLRGKESGDRFHAGCLDNETVFHIVSSVSQPFSCYEKYVPVIVKDRQEKPEPNDQQKLVILATYQEPNLYATAYFWSPTSQDWVSSDGLLFHPTKAEFYSRINGVIDRKPLEQAHVLLVGLGSGSSPVSIELAKAGVGRLTLIDHDILELGNIVRHSCGFRDIGRFKVFALRDLILNTNPFIKVDAYTVDVTSLASAVYRDVDFLKDILKDCDMIVCGTDSNASRETVDHIAWRFQIPVIYGWCGTRASHGGIFFSDPDKKDGPCVGCFNSSASSEDSEISNVARARRDLPPYSSGDPTTLVQPALSLDIMPISTMLAKLTIFRLAKIKDPTRICQLKDFGAHIGDLNYFFWLNSLDCPYGTFAAGHCLSETTSMSLSRWYGVNFPQRKDCLECLTRAEQQKDCPDQ